MGGTRRSSAAPRWPASEPPYTQYIPGLEEVKRGVLQAGGFPQLSLMEDIAFCKRAQRLAQPACLRQRVLTSARRWERNGIWRTIFLMWRLRLAYFLGGDPERLARQYGYREQA